MEIGNIVSKDKMNLGSEFKIVETLDQIVNSNIPTLIVGCEYTRELFTIELNFLNRKINDNLFWTFTKKEVRKVYYNDLEDFIQHCHEQSVKKLHYIYFDLINYSDRKNLKILKNIIKCENPYSFKYNNMIYMYWDKFIVGIDLELVKFFGFDIIKIINKIKNKSKVFLEGPEILIEYKDYLERLGYSPKYVPFIYSISNYD